jgi:large subunit ribosomal protein L18
MNKMKAKTERAARRAHRVRVRLRGSADIPRLTVKRSLNHIYAQLVDDAAGKTLAAASDKGLKAGKPVEVAKAVGLELARKAKASGISAAVFDRGQYRYHGRVAALADGAREGGLTF